jgi:ABC-type multidrug transport system ATPase subunit
MKILAGLLEPTAGRVALYGTDVLAHPDLLRSQLGYLPQEFGFYDHLTGEKMLTYLLRLKGVEAPQGLKRLAHELLERVDLLDVAKRKIKTYSGGMRQRLGIAQAVAGSPKVIIVDEPTAGLDPEQRLRFYKILAELASDRIVLLSTHIVEDVAVLCPRFAVIRNGRLLTQTSPSEARDAIAGRIFEGRISREALDHLDGRVKVVQSVLVEGKNRVRIFEPDAAPPEGFEPVPATLEDAYLLLMAEERPPQPAPFEPALGAHL